MRMNARRVKDNLHGHWAPVYEALVPSNKLKGRGTWKSTTCPFHDDHNPSLGVNIEHGGWCCHAGCGSGDAFSFVMRLEQCTFSEAVLRIARLGGMYR